MTKTLLLFDIDGTLMRSNGAGMRAMRTTANHLFGDDFTLDGIHTAGHLDPLIFAEAAAINGLDHTPTHHRSFRDHYLRQLQIELDLAGQSVTAMPGILDTLNSLRARVNTHDDTILGLLTGNYTEAVPIKLSAVGIDPDWFTITAFGDEASARPDLVRLALDRYEEQTGQPPDPRRVVVIGDTPRDVNCAREHGCIAFTVATGPFSVDQLRDAGADVAVSDLSDPAPLLAYLDPPTAAQS